MTEEEKKCTMFFIKSLFEGVGGCGLKYLQQEIIYLPLAIQSLPFVQTIKNGNSDCTQYEILDQAKDLFISDLMELAENEYDNGLPQNIQ